MKFLAMAALLFLSAPYSISVTPRNVNCGQVQIGQRSNNPDFFIIKNTGVIAVAVTSVSDNPEFQVQQGSCGLLPGQSCFVDITFAPSGTGLRSGVVTVTKIEDGQSVGVNVSGVGE
jgi:hypothetical protein